MSVEWDVKWCSVSRITIPLARKRPFHWISMKSSHMGGGGARPYNEKKEIWGGTGL